MLSTWLRSLSQVPLWAWFASFAGATILGLSFAFVVLYTIFAPNIAPGTDIWAINKTTSVSIADKDGKVFANRGAAFGNRVHIRDMPKYLPAAFLVVEDRRFYDHWGIDLRGLMRAAISNVEAGNVVAGGSTITQQLAKNVFLKPERTFSRKFEELFIAFWLERHYSKDDILSYYLNRIYLGSGAYGVDAASRQYFGKPVKDVTVAEAAMLAALTRAPSLYSPETDYEKAKTRANLVLDLMVEDEIITPEQAKKAKANPPKLVVSEDIDSEGYFADFTIDQLNKLGLTGKNDVIVRTTIDRKLQREAQRAVTTFLNKEGSRRKVSQGALVAMEPDGTVRAIVGGRSYNESSFNRAFQAQRQPGSAFKPFVYLTALERGISPEDYREDEPYEDNGWSPNNYDNDYRGPVTVREALARSLNTVAVRLADEVGRNAVIRIAQRLGIDSALEPNRSLPLGTSEVNLLELTGAYASFANGGYLAEPYCIIDVKLSDGTVLYQRQEQTRKRVMSSAQDQDMNRMLFDAVQTGTGKNADMGERPVAGKTGTTQDYRDAWFVGFSADYVAGVWFGNDDNSPTRRVVGGGLPASVWKSFMRQAHKGLPLRPLPGVDLYAQPDPGYYLEQPAAPPPYAPPPPRLPPPPDTPGLLERSVEELFGSGDWPDEDRRPPPRDGPYRQPEPEDNTGLY